MIEYILRHDSKAIPVRMETIVRCKDCEHCFVTRFGKRLCVVSRDVYYDLFKQVKPDGFCSWAELKKVE